MKKTALIFGGSGGIGSSIGNYLAKLGFKICVADLREPSGSEKKYFTKCDVTSESDIKKTVSYAHEKMGSIGVVVNCQGIYLLECLEKITVDDFDKMVNVNLKSIFLVLKNIIPIMKWQKSGYIVNIASMAGLRGKSGQSAYCASKFGVVGLTEAMFEELRNSGVRITALCPTSVDTSLLRNQVELTEEEVSKILKPEDIARIVAEIVTSNERVYRKIVPIEIDIDIDKLEKKIC